MAESQLSHLPVPAIGGMKEGGRVELVHHKYNKEKPIIHDLKECVLEDLRTYVEDYFYLSIIAENYQT